MRARIPVTSDTGNRIGSAGARRLRGFVISGGGERVPSLRPDGYLTTVDAAEFIGVSASTIRQWRARGWLAIQGLDEKRYPLHTREAVRAAERRVRENGLTRNGTDPRQQRKPRAALGPAPSGDRLRHGCSAVSFARFALLDRASLCLLTPSSSLSLPSSTCSASPCSCSLPAGRGPARARSLFHVGGGREVQLHG